MAENIGRACPFIGEGRGLCPGPGNCPGAIMVPVPHARGDDGTWRYVVPAPELGIAYGDPVPMDGDQLSPAYTWDCWMALMGYAAVNIMRILVEITHQLDEVLDAQDKLLRQMGVPEEVGHE